MTYDIYHETLAHALQHSLEAANRAGAVLDLKEWSEECVCLAPVNYGQAASLSFPLLTLRNKATRKHLQVSIYRMESGRYELTQYFL